MEATKNTTMSESGHYEIHSRRSQMPFMEDLNGRMPNNEEVQRPDGIPTHVLL